MFTSLVLFDCRVQLLFGNRIALNPRLGGLKDVASAIISHERTLSNRVCCFQTLDAVFPKDLFSDYLEITTAVVVPCGDPKMFPVLLCLHFLVLRDCRVQRLFGNRVALNPELGGVQGVAFASIFHEQTQSNRVCCFRTGCCISKRISFQII